MSEHPRETIEIHPRLLKCGLEVADTRAFWALAPTSTDVTAKRAFEEYWFGARSLARIDELLVNMRARFSAWPHALHVLHHWPHMSPDTRTLICHWHVQLTDPLYRQFTGEFLVARRLSARPELTRDLVVDWVSQHGPQRWTMATRIQCASKLLSAAHAAGLVASKRDPRPLTVPRVPDDALEYLLHLLRETTFTGSLLQNPYLASVGLDGHLLDDRLRSLPSVALHRQASLTEMIWRFPTLRAWGDSRLANSEPSHAGGVE
jgi:hypothetical protein